MIHQTHMRFVNAARAASCTVSVTRRSSLRTWASLCVSMESVREFDSVSDGGGRAAPNSLTRILMPFAAAMRVRFSGSKASAPIARQACDSTAGCLALFKHETKTTIPFAYVCVCRADGGCGQMGAEGKIIGINNAGSDASAIAALAGPSIRAR